MRRRGFLRSVGVGTALGGGGLGLLVQACTPAAPAAPPAATAGPTGTSSLTLPTYVAFQGPPADLPDSPDGLVPPGYLNYPRSPTRSVQQPVGSGEDVTAVTYTTQAPPTPAEQNPAWQRVNQETGFNVKLPLTQLADYPTKLNTIIAGGASSLPDLLSLGAGNGLGIANLPEFLQSQCTDLTPLVSGDAVKQFPNLANLPPYAWRNAVFNNRIFAVPSVRHSISNSIMFGKGTLLEPVGGINFPSTDDFLKAMKQLSGGGSQWGLGSTSGAPTNGLPAIATYFLESFGAPNVWRSAGGKLTKDWETDEFQAAIAYVRQLWDAGVIHPDSPTMSVNQAAQNFYAGKYALWANGLIIGDVVWNRANAQDRNFSMRAVAPFPAKPSSKPVHHLGTGANLLTVLRKTTADQAAKLLGLLNYVSAPFGTQEYLTMWYGVEGVEFDFDQNHNPVISAKGQTDLFIPWPNVGAAPSVLYDASSADYARVISKDVAPIQGMGIPNPVVGLYSQTNAQRAASLNQKMGDDLMAIIFGRSEMSSYDQLVADWRGQGGDQIRAEFEQALQSGHN
ncbi:MAG: extracellular solute-binding protein [Chloroflexi bacterium]|nr:extracellular solute-binding protein [Chloroflexota bacterium]MBV9898567.1 extracellular solute-binding protein [Chloroflexota bacterium]